MADMPFLKKTSLRQGSDHLATHIALFAAIRIKLSPKVLASYGVPVKNVHLGSWKYGCKVPIFAPLRKGGTAERPLKQGKEREIGRAESAPRSTGK